MTLTGDFLLGTVLTLAQTLLIGLVTSDLFDIEDM